MIDYEKSEAQIVTALKQDHPQQALVKLVLDFSKKGETKKDIYQLFFDYYTLRGDTEDYLEMEKTHGDHPVALTMDRLSGWCSPTAILLPDED